MRTNIGETGLGKTKITSLLAAERDQLVNACVVFPRQLRGPYITWSPSLPMDNLLISWALWHLFFGLDSTQTMSSDREAQSTTKRTSRSTTCGRIRQAHLHRHPLELEDFAVSGRRHSHPNRMREYLPISNHLYCRGSGSSPVCRCSVAGGSSLGVRLSVYTRCIVRPLLVKITAYMWLVHLYIYVLEIRSSRRPFSHCTRPSRNGRMA